jgi:hypothetical protein
MTHNCRLFKESAGWVGAKHPLVFRLRVVRLEHRAQQSHRRLTEYWGTKDVLMYEAGDRFLHVTGPSWKLVQGRESGRKESHR